MPLTKHKTSMSAKRRHCVYADRWALWKIPTHNFEFGTKSNLVKLKNRSSQIIEKRGSPTRLKNLKGNLQGKLTAFLIINQND